MKSDPHSFAAQQSEFLEKFLKTRKSKDTKEYVRIILGYLTEKMGVETQGWVRSRDLVNELVSANKIPNTSTFYKLLSDLVDAHLVEPRTGEKEEPGPGPLPKYYRASIAFPIIFFMTREELLEEYDKLLWDKSNLAARLGAARELLKKCHEGEEGYNAEKAIKDFANSTRVMSRDNPVQNNGEKYIGFLDWIEMHRNKVYGKKSKS
jgi:hypothetical protein